MNILVLVRGMRKVLYTLVAILAAALRIRRDVLFFQ